MCKQAYLNFSGEVSFVQSEFKAGSKWKGVAGSTQTFVTIVDHTQLGFKFVLIHEVGQWVKPNCHIMRFRLNKININWNFPLYTSTAWKVFSFGIFGLYGHFSRSASRYINCNYYILNKSLQYFLIFWYLA